MCGCMGRWMGSVGRTRRLRQIGGLLAARRMAQGMARWWHAWRLVCDQHVRSERLARVGISWLVRGQCGRAWDRWKEHVCKKARMTKRVLAAKTLCKQTVYGTVVSAWRAVVLGAARTSAETSRRERCARVLASRLGRCDLGWSFHEWRELARRSRQLGQVCRTLVWRWLNMEAAVVVRRWQAQVVRAKRVRQVMMKALRRHGSRCVVEGLRGWRRQVQSKAVAKSLMCRAMERVRHAKQVHAVAGWREGALRSRRVREVCIKALARGARACLAEYLHRWRGAVRKRRCVRRAVVLISKGTCVVAFARFVAVSSGHCDDFYQLGCHTLHAAYMLPHSLPFVLLPCVALR